MKSEMVQTLTNNFEDHAQQTEGGVEYWLARDLQHLLGYAEWRNFNSTAISKARVACEVSGHAVADHFGDVNKMVRVGVARMAHKLVRQCSLQLPGKLQRYSIQ